MSVPPKLPQGLDPTVIACGFDAVSWDFLHRPIFDLTFTNRTVNLRQGNGFAQYDVPDGMTVDPDYSFDYMQAMIFKGVHCLDEETYSSSMEASLGVDGVSLTASTSLARFSSIETDDKETTTTVGCYKIIYHFTRDEVGNLLPPFKDDLDGLPSSFESGTSDKFFDFFRKWGTHFLAGGFFGGDFVMNTFIEEKVFNTLKTSDVTNAVKGGFNDGVDNASAKAQIEEKTRDLLQLNSKQSRIQFHSLGGDSDKEIDDWLKSVDVAIMFLNDVLAMTTKNIRPLFAPIWQLADESRQAALKQAWSAYPPADEQQDDTLPPPTTGQIDTNVQSAADGFLSVLLGASPGGDPLHLGEIHAHTDTDPNPKRRVAGAGVFQQAACKINQASLFVPVRRGDYYIASYGQHYGNLSNTVTFQPFPLGFGNWLQLSFNQIYNGRDEDGFVVVAIDRDTDHEGQFAGFVIGSQVLNGNLTPCAGASIGGGGPTPDGRTSWVLTDSFCMPVAKGTAFRIDLTNRPPAWLPIIGSVFWIPMDPSHKMQTLRYYRPNEWNLADTHGILTGFLSQEIQSNNPSVGLPYPSTFAVLTAPTTQDFTNPSIVGTATVQYSGGHPIQYNSATAVIRKSSYFLVSIESQIPDYSATITWVGIVAA